MKPLGLPVKTPFGFYYYETQKNEILSIKQELYEYLDCLIKKGEYDKDMLAKFSELVADKGFCWKIDDILPAIMC